MNKTEREQLKHNEAADALVAASSYLSQYGRLVGLAAVAVLLLVNFSWWYKLLYGTAVALLDKLAKGRPKQL